MREILFRGKRIDNGEWVYGFLYETEKSSSYNAESYILEKERLTINYKCVEGITTHIPFVQVTPETVGQYTGLTDKNGEKMFEGDILEHTNPNRRTHREYVIADHWSFKWSHGVYGFSLTDLNGGYMLDLRYSKSYEVIGNIHDNPELLEVRE